MPKLKITSVFAWSIYHYCNLRLEAPTRTLFWHQDKKKRLKIIQEHWIDKTVVGKAEVDKPDTNLTVLYINTYLSSPDYIWDCTSCRVLRMASLAISLDEPRSTTAPNACTRRILSEINGFRRNPHTDIEIFPSEERWKMLLSLCDDIYMYDQWIVYAPVCLGLSDMLHKWN